eukprot:scaffold14392_cov151-Skeletonema_menzelii.AAC.7
MTKTRKDALKAVAVVGLASLVSCEADIRDSADNIGNERRLQYLDESWYDIPDPMQSQYQPVHYQQPPPPPMYNDGGELWWHGGEVMPEAKAGKEHSNGGVASEWWQGHSGKTSGWSEPYGWPQWETGSSKSSKTLEEEAPIWWQPGAGKVEKHEPVIVTTHATEAEWWAGSGKSGKSAKAKSTKASSSGHWWASSSEQGWGSMQTTSTAATMPVTTTAHTTTTHSTTIPAGKGDKDDAWTGTTSTWWAQGWPAPKSGKAAKSGKSGKSGKSAKTGETGWWDSTWSTPKPCGKAEDCEHNTPPSEGHTEAEANITPPVASPVDSLVPVTMAPVAGLETRAVPATSSPTTIIDALTSEAGWFQSGKNYETEELAYKRERVEGLAKQMEWKNSSSRPQVYPYVAVGAAAGLFFMIC